jgi:hypothetical protein
MERVNSVPASLVVVGELVGRQIWAPSRNLGQPNCRFYMKEGRKWYRIEEGNPFQSAAG